ncbi:hypothetical protein ACTNEW_03725 [Blautia sp. HCP3S3_G3]|uniref:hypothetical protein n=1 Tax=Blautia sp. HCP3S3_G3 TaxID=3438913 RepID=UPI003F88EC47
MESQTKNEIKDLIESNLRQRGIGNPNPIKLGRCIKELERIYGIRDGSSGKQKILDSNNLSLKQTDLAEKLGMSMQTLQNYKLLADMIPELSDLVDTGTHADLFNM